MIDAGVIVTRSSDLQKIFKSLGKKVADKYGASTTHMEKLLPRLNGGGGGGCPIIAFGITKAKYIEDAAPIGKYAVGAAPGRERSMMVPEVLFC